MAAKNYPMVVFDPITLDWRISTRFVIGDRYHATLPIFEQEADTVAQIVSNLGYPLTEPMHLMIYLMQPKDFTELNKLRN